ncbi:MAG: class I SAM-dependent methyltransferase [Candidatus Omnitrophica bacterium]|nr:class I SAM-dependent methyltransferase [Candidatus Omnitrophota bacterium]
MKSFYNKEFYSKEASKYDQERWISNIGSYTDKTQKDILKSMIPDISGKKVLEIGAGTGRFSLLLAELGADVVALDVSQEMLNIINKKAAERNFSEKINTIQVDVSTKLPFPDEEFDLCIIINVLSHIDKPMHLFEDIYKVMKPGGVFISNYPNLTSLYFLYGLMVNLKGQSLRENVFTKWYSLCEINKVHKNKFSMHVIKGQVHLPVNSNNKILTTLIKKVDRFFRESFLRYFAPIIFVKSIKNNRGDRGGPQGKS